MKENQREANPDVNTFNIRDQSNVTEQEESGHDLNPGTEQIDKNDLIPVPPDALPAAPIEEPPGTKGQPIGDVDDSPKQFAED